MAQQQEQEEERPQDPFETALCDGRCLQKPTHYPGFPQVLNLDLQALFDTLSHHLSHIYTNDPQFRSFYRGTHDVTNTITQDVSAMLTFAMLHTYNRLRAVLEEKYPAVRRVRMNPKSTNAHRHHVFPTWLSSLLGCIGPCRVNHGAPRDQYVVWATPAANMNNFGFINPPEIRAHHYQRFLDVCRLCAYPLSPFDSDNRNGSFYPTINVQLNVNGDTTFTCYATVHPSHYENEDIVRALVCSTAAGGSGTPFERVGMTIGYLDDEAALKAIAAAPAPAGNPAAGSTVNSAGRLNGFLFNTNYFGIKPAIPATGDNPPQPRGAYLVGRGDKRYFQTQLAEGISEAEIYDCMRHRLRYGPAHAHPTKSNNA